MMCPAGFNYPFCQVRLVFNSLFLGGEKEKNEIFFQKITFSIKYISPLSQLKKEKKRKKEKHK